MFPKTKKVHIFHLKKLFNAIYFTIHLASSLCDQNLDQFVVIALKNKKQQIIWFLNILKQIHCLQIYTILKILYEYFKILGYLNGHCKTDNRSSIKIQLVRFPLISII